MTVDIPFEELLEAAPDAIVVVDEAGRIAVANHQAIELFGYPREELIGRTIDILIPAGNRDRHPQLRHGYFRQPGFRPMGAGLDLRAVRKDGSEFPVDISLSPLETKSGTLVSAAVRDITDRRRAEEALREAKEEAEHANQAKTEFLSRMSHELRTPLTAILGFTELLQMGGLEDEQRDSFIDRTHKAGQHLLTLVNDVLDLSRVQTGTLSVSIESIAVRPVVDEVVELLAPLAAQRDVTVVNDVADDVVRADLNRLKQVLLNLVSNAVKYNQEGGTVTLSSVLTDDAVEIEVGDTGGGIAARDLPRLFQPFERLGLHSGDVEGTGIGLALSQALTEWMGGTIRAASEVGVGSRFTLQLPRGKGVTMDPHSGGTVSVAVEHSGTVLYIEDNPSNTVLVESALSLRANVRIVSAVQGQMGLDLAREHRPDLILLDLHLPDMSGETVLAALKADPRTVTIPVVVLSADATPRRIDSALSAGAQRYMTKPFAIHELLDAVDSALAARSA